MGIEVSGDWFEPPGEATVWLWDVIPFTEGELATFRAQPTAQGAWMDERVERGDIPLIQQRFTRG